MLKLLNCYTISKNPQCMKCTTCKLLTFYKMCIQFLNTSKQILLYIGFYIHKVLGILYTIEEQ